MPYISPIISRKVLVYNINIWFVFLTYIENSSNSSDPHSLITESHVHPKSRGIDHVLIRKQRSPVLGESANEKRSINTTLSNLPNCPKGCLCMEVSQTDPAFYQDPYASYTPSIYQPAQDFGKTSNDKLTSRKITIPDGSRIFNDRPSTTTLSPAVAQRLAQSSTQVICSNTDIKILPRNLPPNTIKLDLSQNEISFIASRAFEGLPIRTLILDDNEIREIKPYAFAGMDNLASLLMKNNPLDVLGQNSMSGINGSRTINLGSNHIERIEREAFEDTQNIEFIDLSENPLTYVKTKAFCGLRNVKFLVLSASGLKFLEPGCFDGLENVNHISMTRVPLSEFQPNTFRGLKNVDNLEIRYAKVGRIRDYAFRDAVNIKRITLSQINLERLDKRAFSGLVLKTVTPRMQSKAKITTISQNVPTTTTTMDVVKYVKSEKLDLSKNKLRHMDPLLFADFANSFKTVDLSGNPFVCACNMSWVTVAKYFYDNPKTSLSGFTQTKRQQELLTNATFRFNPDHIGQLRCSTPIHLKGRLMADINFNREFGCDQTEPFKFAEDLNKALASGGNVKFSIFLSCQNILFAQLILLTIISLLIG